MTLDFTTFGLWAICIVFLIRLANRVADTHRWWGQLMLFLTGCVIGASIYWLGWT
jgi:hypothetical protein